MNPIVHNAVRDPFNALMARYHKGSGYPHPFHCQIYLVGGAVRDSFMGRPSKDQDFVITGVPLDRVIDLLTGYGKVDIAGKSFGVIKFRPAGQDEVFDIALPRREKSTGARRSDFLIEADPNISIFEDLNRRDFSINSIAINIFTGEVIDPFNGRADLSSKTLRITFENSFSEDPTRILRAVQFAARMGFRFAPETSASMKKNAFRVKSEAPERISTEICKLLVAEKPSLGFALMRSHGVLEHVIPELSSLSGIPQPKQYHKFDVLSHCLVACDKTPVKGKNVTRRLTALLHDIGKLTTLTFKEDGTPQFLGHDKVGADMARNFLSRLCFTAVDGYTVDCDRIVNAIEHHMFDADIDSSDRTIRRLVSKVGRGNMMDLIRLRISDRAAKGFSEDLTVWTAFARRVRCLGHGNSAFTVKDLAINGNDVMTHLSIKPGKKVGEILNGLLQMVLDDPTKNTRETLLSLAQIVPNSQV